MIAFYKRARAEEPIFFNPKLDMVVVTKYDDIHRIMHDTETFSAIAALDLIKPLCREALQIAIDAGVRVDRIIVDQDPPEHTVKRRALRPPFHPQNISEFVPKIEKLIDDRMDRLVDRGEADLVGDLMFEVPALVVFQMFGLSEDELPTVRKYAKSNAKFGFGYPTDEEQVQDTRDLVEYWKWCRARVDEMFDDPGDDVVGQFVTTMRQNPEYGIDKETTTTLMMQLLFAGHETTANSAGNMFRFLLTFRDQWEAVCADPSLIPNAVEESCATRRPCRSGAVA